MCLYLSISGISMLKFHVEANSENGVCSYSWTAVLENI